ncbi:ricin-type beta-trefoil lectin domain protein [Kibdelosporangium lantanae]|uniref:Ricin-type beta-trefoil lectin domain protein n=1 Tax=Kibdelosporangium lantanae TaxID=1497396 RepID=A0ABW3M540_9PSEU
MLVTLRKMATVGLVAFLAVIAGTATASAVQQTRIQNWQTLRCMDDSDFAFRTNLCNHSEHQQWIITRLGDGTYKFQNYSTGRCMEDTDLAFRTTPCDDNSVAQKWWVIDNSTVVGGKFLDNVLTHRFVDDSDFAFRTNTFNGSMFQTFFYE